ncbi:MAG: response regulator [Verrucomicrobiota bacterium]|jgi:DNA-binding response OmpR family regulator
MARILLIDDDEMLRTVLAIAIDAAGHEVLQAEDGQKGMELVRTTSVDLVITDLIMPVQEGVETIMTLRRERPRLPVIAMSGGASNSKLYLDIAGKIGAKRMLPKPFTPRQLVALITEILAEEKPRSGSI